MLSGLKTLSESDIGSLTVGIFQDTIEKSIWHYHREYELTFVTEGSGKRIVGDSIKEFHPGDLILIGPQLPHVWVADKPIVEMPFERTLETVYVLFDHSILPESLLRLPELTMAGKAIKMAQRGLQIKGETLHRVSELMLQLPYLDDFTRLMYFYEILKNIGESEFLNILASEDYIKTKFTSNNDRLNKVHEYLMTHYQEEINLSAIASLVHLAPGSLCRFFKSNMGLPIFEYLNKIKVNYACKLLMDESLSITGICFDCGFNNLSHFNKQFKKHCGFTPREYRKQCNPIHH